MRNKFKEERLKTNLTLYRNLFRSQSFQEFSDILKSPRPSVEGNDRPGHWMEPEVEYRIRKASGEDGLGGKVPNLIDFEDLNTIQRGANIQKRGHGGRSGKTIICSEILFVGCYHFPECLFELL